MDLILLQLKRDIRSGWALLGTWWGLCGLYAVTAASFLKRNPYFIDHGDGVGRVAELISAGWWLAGFLAAWWILLDPPADENAFWRARPLRWSRLLAAKALLMLGGLLVPLALAQGVLVVGLDAGGWWTAVLADMARTQLGWIVGLAALAALCGSWRRMLSIALACWVGAVGAYVVLDGLSQWGVLGLRSHRLKDLMLSSEALVTSGWLPVVAGVALVLQYAFRRPAGTVAAILVLCSGWILFHPANRIDAPGPAPAPTEDLPEFTVGIQRDRQLWHMDQNGELSGIVAVLELEDPPAPYFSRPLFFSETKALYSNGWVHTGGQLNAWDEDHPQALRMYRSAVPGLTIRNPNPRGLPSQWYATLADYDQMLPTMVERSWPGGQTSIWVSRGPQEYAGRQGVFKSDLVFEVVRHEPVVELPVEVGSSWADGPNRIVMLGTNPGGENRTMVRLRVQWLKLEQDRSLESVHCLLVNRDRGEALVPTQTQTIRWIRIRPFATQDFRVVYEDRGGDDTFMPVDDDWLAGASVLVVTRSAVGRVTKHLRLEEFRLWPDPGELE